MEGFVLDDLSRSLRAFGSRVLHAAALAAFVAKMFVLGADLSCTTMAVSGVELSTWR